VSDDPAELDTTEAEFDQMWVQTGPARIDVGRLNIIEVLDYYDGVLEFVGWARVNEVYEDQDYETSTSRAVHGILAPDSSVSSDDERLYDCWLLPPRPNPPDERWGWDHTRPDFQISEGFLSSVLKRSNDVVGQPRRQGTAEDPERQAAPAQATGQTGRDRAGRRPTVVVNGDDELPDTPSDRLRE
jgi:hypothetical protein